MSSPGSPPSEPPIAGDEVGSLLGSLERQRATLAWKCGGLDAAGMCATLGPSTMTLAGLLKHLAFVEDVYFTWRLHGRDFTVHWPGIDLDDPEWVWSSATSDDPEALRAHWRAATDRSRAAVAEALEHGGLDQRVAVSDGDEAPSLRRVVVDLIEEYARHVGHADLLREAADGLVGEDPPR